MAANDREKALDSALAQIERQFGRGSIMRLGEETRAPIEVIPTGAIALDVALGIGGLPRGRIVESMVRRPVVRPPSLCIPLPVCNGRAASRRSLTPSTHSIRNMPSGSVWTWTVSTSHSPTPVSRR